MQKTVHILIKKNKCIKRSSPVSYRTLIDSAPFFVHSIKGVKLITILISPLDYSSFGRKRCTIILLLEETDTDFKPKNMQYLCDLIFHVSKKMSFFS